ncbi:MAG: hypothetical protein IKC77_05840, partial [Lentisphaeria bacterium]|nr:hypothetical protein [Lentisphaeria bacterium]
YAKHFPCLALHPPMVMGRFAYLAALVVYKSTLPALLGRKTLSLTHTHPPMLISRFAFCRNPNLLHISHKSGLYQIKKFPRFS